MRKAVLILPCNKGARVGDYYSSPTWRYARRLLEEEGVRSFTRLAAVDSIITLYDPRGDRDEMGAVVLEGEEWRVAGYDAKPTLEKFLRDARLFKSLVRDVRRGVERLLFQGFSEVYAVLWVAAYQAALHEALLEIEGAWPSWATMVITPPSPLASKKAIKLATRLIRSRTLGRRVILEEHVAPWIRFWSMRGRQLGTYVKFDEIAISM